MPDTIKTLPPVKLDEKTQFIGVVAYFSDDQATEWKQIETVEGTGHHYRLLVHVRQSSIEMKKRMNNYGNHPQQGDVAGRMLMRPHHFQQQQRYNDYLDNQRFRAMNDLSWGFTELTLNNELLAQGKIMIDSASGTLPDGTVFSIPDQDALPDPLHPQNFPDERSRNIYLALPVASDVRNEISDGRRIGRYRLNYADVRDLHSEEGDARTLTLGQLTPRIMSGAEDMSAYITLPLCRISDRHADGS